VQYWLSRLGGHGKHVAHTLASKITQREIRNRVGSYDRLTSDEEYSEPQSVIDLETTASVTTPGFRWRTPEEFLSFNDLLQYLYRRLGQKFGDVGQKLLTYYLMDTNVEKSLNFRPPFYREVDNYIETARKQTKQQDRVKMQVLSSLGLTYSKASRILDFLQSLLREEGVTKNK
jgi:hypothetical protein